MGYITEDTSIPTGSDVVPESMHTVTFRGILENEREGSEPLTETLQRVLDSDDYDHISSVEDREVVIVYKQPTDAVGSYGESHPAGEVFAVADNLFAAVEHIDRLERRSSMQGYVFTLGFNELVEQTGLN